MIILFVKFLFDLLGVLVFAGVWVCGYARACVCTCEVLPWVRVNVCV